MRITPFRSIQHPLLSRLLAVFACSACALTLACGDDDPANVTSTDTSSAADTATSPDTTPDTSTEADTSATPDTSTEADTTQDDTTEDAPDTSPPLDNVFPYTYLSTYGLFEVGPDTPLSDLKPAARVVPYSVNAVLFADDSEKARFLYLPEGEAITFHDADRWTFPEGSVAIKDFFYWRDARDHSLGKRRLETRLMVLKDGRWRPLTYVWNEDQTEATRLSTGDNIDVTRVDADGQTVTSRYLVPNNNQCKNCHDQSRTTVLLGPVTRQMNHAFDYGDGAGPTNQLTHLSDLGWFDAPLPALDTLPFQVPFTDTSYTNEERARSYLDVNCSHCHNPDGSASSTGLNLSIRSDREIDLGVCRRPFSAGRGSGDLSFDIVPGDPDASIMIFRMSSTDPEIKMPELPTRTSDHVGAGIIRAWISDMPSRICE
jgi:uncharacterized repeat protein (TIGR03806 family)